MYTRPVGSQHNTSIDLRPEHGARSISMATRDPKSASNQYRASRKTSIPCAMQLALLLLAELADARTIHHMQRRAPQRLLARQDGGGTPLHVTNRCSEDIYPGINTQSGTGPSENGFKLQPNETRELYVSHNWQGRLWGRTNCSFNEDGTKPSHGSVGKACGSGDCNGVLDCKVGGDVPVTLAEFTLDAGDGQTYYDISLVDGYNIPMAIVLEPHGNASLKDLPPNLTNPTCTGTVGLLAPRDWQPYKENETFLNTNEAFPLPLDTKIDDERVANWCPWNLQVNTPKPPDDGRFMYPDNSVQRPIFNPCFSACAKFNLPQDCCLGEYRSPTVCQPSEYSKNAKAVCPDAYSYAFDDQTSTFIIPSGSGFNIVFCPGGRSSNILTAESHNVSDSSNGQISFGNGGSHADRKPTQSADRSNGQRLQQNSRHDEYDWTGVRDMHMPLGGIRVLDLVKKGMHLRDWEARRKFELQAQELPGRIKSFLRLRSSAAGVTAAGEVRSSTLYLMGAGLGLTAAVFMML